MVEKGSPPTTQMISDRISHLATQCVYQKGHVRYIGGLKGLDRCTDKRPRRAEDTTIHGLPTLIPYKVTGRVPVPSGTGSFDIVDLVIDFLSAKTLLITI